MTQEITGPDYYYTNFIGSHVKGSKPVAKSFETANGKVSYNEVPLTYNYGTPENPIIDACFFECPIVTSFGGIQKKVESKPGKTQDDPPYVKTSYSMMFTFDIQDPECVACLEKLDQLHQGTAHALAAYKGDLKMFSFVPESPGEAFKHPVYYKMDLATCERIKGSKPSMWVKLNSWKTNKTLFTDVNGNPVDWTLLEDVELKLLPLLHVEKIYVGGGKASLQIKLASAVITSIVPINSVTRQTRTLDRLKARPGLADSVAQQLAELRMSNQDKLDDGHFHPTNAHLPPNPQMSGDENSNHSSQDALNAYLGGTPVQQPPQQFQPQSTPVQQPPQQFQPQSTPVQQPPQQFQPQSTPVQQPTPPGSNGAQPQQYHQPAETQVQFSQQAAPPQTVQLQIN
jgi:hypothetical protein